MLIALDFHLGPVEEFAVVGDPASDETRRVLRAVRGRFQPNRVVALKAANDAAVEKLIPLLADKTAKGDGDDVHLPRFRVSGAAGRRGGGGGGAGCEMRSQRFLV